MATLIEGQAIWSESRHLVFWSHKGKCTISYVNSCPGREASREGKLEKRGEMPCPHFFANLRESPSCVCTLLHTRHPLCYSSDLGGSHNVSAQIKNQISCRDQLSCGLFYSFLLLRKRSLSIQSFEGKMGLFFSAYFKYILTERCGECGFFKESRAKILKTVTI